MRPFARMVGWMIAGLGIAWLATLAITVDAGLVAGSGWYLYGTSALLAVGLYGSTYGIDLVEARRHRRLIVLAITVGVVIKAALIGGSLALAFREPLFLVLGVAVAQIDPLAVAAIMGDRRMSNQARTILAAWSSLDDPVTVVVAVYAAAIAHGFGLGGDLPQGVPTVGGVPSYLVDVAANLGYAAAWLCWRGYRALDRRLTGAADGSGATRSASARRLWSAVPYLLLGAFVGVAIWQFLMLGLALAGLFLRPVGLARVLPRLVTVALATATVLLGALLIGGIDLRRGIALGLAAFGAQVVVGLLLTRRLRRVDRIYLALAQQNGITATILALRLETQFAGVVPVVAPAILVTNVIHLIANHLADRRNGRRETL